MAPKKKFVKYEPSMSLHYGQEHRLMDKYTSLKELLAMHRASVAANGETWDRYRYLGEQVDRGEIPDDPSGLNRWLRTGIAKSAFLSSPEFDEINNKFMAEYNQREDLQELYRTCAKEAYYLYNRYGNMISPRDPSLNENPAEYRMYAQVANSSVAKNMIEKARESPFQEGDLVLLRKPYIGHDRIDPYYVDRYAARTTGTGTPDSSVPRIGTVIGVTDELSRAYHAPKGSKVLKVLWMGKEDITSIELRYIKWHERPTLKNGLKVRE